MYRTNLCGKAYIFAILFLLAGLFFTMPLEAATASKQSDIEKQIKAEEQRLKKIQGQITTYKKRERDAVQKERKVIKDINELSSRMSETEQLHNIAVLRRNQVLNKLADTTSQIAVTTKKIERARELLSGRMVAVYKYGGVAEFNLLMSAGGAQDALSTSYLLGKIAEQDRELIHELSTHKNALDKAREELIKQKTELEKRNKELEKQKVTIQKTSQERNRLLDQVRKDKALFQAEQAELLRASKELQNKVTELLAAKKKMQEAQRNGATPVYFKGGRLAWPLRGKINSPYGGRIHPVFKTKTTHTGIDINGNKGDPARAAADGEILYTGWLRGYGQVVIIDHGGNLTTVYAHLSGIDTTENAKVKAGQQIGRVGSTGTATGNHLHFEVRVNGNTVNPMKYLQ